MTPIDEIGNNQAPARWARSKKSPRTVRPAPRLEAMARGVLACRVMTPNHHEDTSNVVSGPKARMRSNSSRLPDGTSRLSTTVALVKG